MPRGQPFTRMCQALARPPAAARADLHVHSTCSDGLYSPEQLVDLARRTGLSALAITDHDTCAAFHPARQAAPSSLEVVPGVEITCEHRERELHLLGYFFDPEDAALLAALDSLRASRARRFRALLEGLATLGIPLRWDEADATRTVAFGRRHLAEMLVAQGYAADVQDAFRRHLHERGRLQVDKQRLPVAEAIALVRAAGGVTSWAHPPQNAALQELIALKEMGLHAVEAGFPACRPARSKQLREWATHLGLAVTAGSDCHGPEPARRGVGSVTASPAEVESLRAMANSAPSVK